MKGQTRNQLRCWVSSSNVTISCKKFVLVPVLVQNVHHLGLWGYASYMVQVLIRVRNCLSMLPFGERCCCGSFGILGVSIFRAGCFSATGSFPLSESFALGVEFLLLADNEDEEVSMKKRMKRSRKLLLSLTSRLLLWPSLLTLWSSQVFVECLCVHRHREYL